MRVIAGKYKGRTLFSPKDMSVRPTTDRIKENIFNLLQGKMAGAKFLDLFGGSGAMSVEALSRGASEAVTVDNARESVALIKRNFAKVGIGREGRILECSYLGALERLHGERFDVVFLDPPYREGLYREVLAALAEGDFLSEEGVVVAERATELPYDPPAAFHLADSRKYGSVTVDIFRRS